MQAQLPSRPRPFVAPKPQSSRQTRIQLPTSSWDSHMHVISPEYPLAASAQYTPKPHLLSEATAFENSLGLSNIVLVQPSIYGTDNSCLLDALRHLGPERARGVVVFDPARIEKRTLDKWHKLGVRGVRVNLVSVGQELDDFQLAKILRAHADIIRPYNWVLNLHVPLTSATALEKIIPSLGVRVCLDHFCQPRLPSLQLQRQHPYTISRDPYKLPGFSALINLLILGNTYVKLSAPYRISKEEGQGDLDPIGRELLRVADRRCVWASDWPHTRYEDIEAAGFVKSVIGWCEETGGEALERVFRRNAEELWDVKS